MSIIKLNENFCIKPYKYGWILIKEEEKQNEEGEILVSRDNWYYPTLDSCLVKFCDVSLKDCKSVSELLNKISSLQTLIEETTPKIYVANNKIITT